jgi:N-terminal half of MaoC dehydratase
MPAPTETRAVAPASSAGWPRNWDAVVAAVGEEFGEDAVAWGADHVELTGIRRFVEPFEFDCALHHDKETARQHGYSDVVAPVASLRMFASPALWEPGNQPVFTDAARDAQPSQASPARHLPSFAPLTTALVMTEVEWDFLQPVIVGDHLGTHMRKRIVACTPKALKIGQGAFVTIEHKLCNQRHELVARIRLTYFCYNPSES